MTNPQPVPKSEQVDDAGLRMQNIADFTKAIEAGDKKAAKKAADETKDKGTKAAMERLIPYIG